MTRKFLGKAAIYTAANIANASIPFLMLPILTRILSPSDYGLVAMFAVMVTILAAFTGLNVHGAISIRYFQQDKFHLPSYVRTCLYILLASTALVVAIVCLAGGWLTAFTGLPLQWIVLAALIASAQFVIQIQLVVWQSSGYAAKYGFLRVGQASLEAASSLVLVVMFGLMWEGRVTGQAIGAVVFVVLALILLRQAGWIKGQFKKEYAVNALKFGLPLVPHTIGGLLIVMSDRFLLTNMIGSASTGIYMVALQIGMGVGLLTDAFNRAYAPWLFENLRSANPELKNRLVKLTYLYFAAVMGGAIIIGLAAPYFLTAIVDDRYLAAAGLVIYIVIGYAFGGMYYMVTNYVFYANRTANLALITLSSGFFNVVVTYFLIKKFGISGAAQGFMISQFLLFICTWRLASTAYEMPWFSCLRKISP